MRTLPYVGLTANGREVFRSATEPTHATHGDRFLAVIGPFRTARAATFTARYGASNPHVQTVHDAERICRRESRA